MSRRQKLITALLAIIFCFSALSVSVFAVDYDGDGIDDDSSYVEPDPTDPPVVTDPYVDPVTDPPYVDPVTDPPYVEPPVTDPPYVEPVTDPPYNYEPEVEETFDTSYVGGGQTYIPPASTAPSAPIYKSEGNIDVNELSDSDWKDISENLKNAGSVDTDGDDFNFIKNNNSMGDNGDWMLVAGVVCLLLSAAGIVYVIASAVSRRKKIAQGSYSSRQPAYASGSGHYRASDDYGDGYKTSGKKEKKKLERSRKYDTADVKLPKSSQGTRYKNNGGKRYK